MKKCKSPFTFEKPLLIFMVISQASAITLHDGYVGVSRTILCHHIKKSKQKSNTYFEEKKSNWLYVGASADRHP